MRLSNRRILLVGASKGLGAATANYLLEEGAIVVITDREDKVLKGVLSLLPKAKTFLTKRRRLHH
ncbi:MAG: SDR family NAD(P)-dependent oxidoreductase [Candidatus Micrarchaeales archaeon]